MKRLIVLPLFVILLMGTAHADETPPSTFSVTVPSQLLISTDSFNNVVVDHNLTLRNDGLSTIRVSEIQIYETNGWTKVFAPTDRVQRKEFSLVVDLSSWVIAPGAESFVQYSASISPQQVSLNEKIADVVFTIDVNEYIDLALGEEISPDQNNSIMEELTSEEEKLITTNGSVANVVYDNSINSSSEFILTDSGELSPG